jgi:hypothetical protein
MAGRKFAGIFARTHSAYLEHEQARTEFEPNAADAKEAIGPMFGPSDWNPAP